jgi:hypothetical protein
MPASRNASSKEVSRSLCFPTPLVKNKRLGTMLFPNSQLLASILMSRRNHPWKTYSRSELSQIKMAQDTLLE